jgi:carotenoid cleavage dioxygenase
LHWINAYEDGDEIILDGYFEYDPSPTMPPDADLNTRLFRFLDLYALQSRPYRWRLNRRTGTVTEGPISDTITEFGMINSAYAGRKYDYTYSAVPVNGWFLFEGVIKHSVQTGTEESYRFAQGVYCSETVFAPRTNSQSEDDGYLISFTTDTVSDASDCVVFDAQRVSDGPIATIRLPEKICSGTHSYWSNHAP